MIKKREKEFSKLRRLVDILTNKPEQLPDLLRDKKKKQIIRSLLIQDSYLNKHLVSIFRKDRSTFGKVMKIIEGNDFAV